MSSDGGIGSTLTGGIQDIAAILPLLGTEQCSVQVTSALTRGYLYAASAPISIFGSLGVVNAGFKTLVACFTFGDIEGAKILGNMGFEPEGENLSLIMVEAGKGKDTEHYIIETRMDELIKQLNIDKNRITGVLCPKSAVWNVKMMTATALLCALSITPYIYLNQVANKLEKSATWVFPVVRATGGFITATLIQLLIQRRITTLSDKYIKRSQLPNTSRDVEAAVETKKYQMDARTWLFLCLLVIGLVASLVGYVGCFSIVQNSTTTIGPISWLCLEAGLSIMRLAIWAWNPKDDDAPPLEIILGLDEYERNPLPTCNKDNKEILQSKVLPLTRARDFLKIITSFAGLIEPFNNPDLSLYYTLTRKRPSKKSRDSEPEDHKLGERTLYITVFDHKERTTRVYTQNEGKDIFYSTKLDAPVVDVGHFLLEVEIDAKIEPKNDPVSSDSNNVNSLRDHYQSILEHIQYRLEDGPRGPGVTKLYAIENRWTMKVEDTISTLKKLRKEKGGDWKTAVEKGKERERNEESLSTCDYFMHSSIEKERRLLDEKRAKWIARRMELITKETKERFQGEKAVEYRVNNETIESIPTISSEEIEQLLREEQYLMELLLLYEVKEWEELFWNKFKAFRERPEIGNGEKERLTREWKADCWKRLNPQMHAAVKRVADSDLGGRLGKRWDASIRQLFEGVKKPNSISLSELWNEIGLRDANDEIRLRMEEEVKDTEFRLKLGSESNFDQFWDDDNLFKCRYSRSKWLYLSQDSASHSAPLEIYLRALYGNRNIIHFTFSDFDPASGFQATIRDLPWVTSISFALQPTPPIIHRDLLFIKSTNNDLKTFAENIRLKSKLDPDSRYIFTDAEGPDLYSGKLENNAKVLISFVAPTSGQLILRLKHSGSEDGTLEAALGLTKIQLNPSSESSLTIDDITLYPIQVPTSNHLLFTPGIQNDIEIQFKGIKYGHFLHDIELLDAAALEDQSNRPIFPKISL